MQNLEQLTATRKSCIELTELGIMPISFFWHTVEDDTEQPPDDEGNPILFHDVCMLACPVFSNSLYGSIPAWTKAELDVMIGPFVKPDLLAPEQVSRNTDPNQFAAYFPTKMIAFKNGAEASATALIYLLSTNMVTADGANSRYQALFQPL